jgi:hypothetical protein
MVTDPTPYVRSAAAGPEPTVEPQATPTGTEDEEPGGLLSAFLKLHVVLGGIAQQLDRQQSANDLLLARLEHDTPIKFRKVGSVIAAGTSGVADWIDLGGPTHGFYYVLESCAIGGTDINVTAAVTDVGLYVTTQTPKSNNNNSPGMSSIVDGGSSLPQVGTYGGRDVVLEAGDHLAVGLWGATAAQEYRANAVFSVYNVAAAKGRTTNIAGL